MKINMTAAQVGVLLQFAAKNDIRNYLNGICLQVGGNKGFAIATDGTILGVFRLHLPEPLEKSEVIIPRDILENAKCTATGADIVIEICQAKGYDGSQEVAVQQGAGQWRGQSYPGTYPDWRRVIPEKISGEAANLSGIVQEKLIKAAKIIQGNKNPLVGLEQNGKSASMLDLGDPDFFGVAMPVRLGDPSGKGEYQVTVPTHRPEWIC
jgi:DNA polymerase-3 subunit beta